MQKKLEKVVFCKIMYRKGSFLEFSLLYIMYGIICIHQDVVHILSIYMPHMYTHKTIANYTIEADVKKDI